MRSFIVLIAALGAGCLAAQQLSFIPVSGPNAPAGVRKMFQDSHGGLWLAGNGSADALRYFDGTRFITPLEGQFPNVLVNAMAEDAEGGIWFGSRGDSFGSFTGRFRS